MKRFIHHIRKGSLLCISFILIAYTVTTGVDVASSETATVYVDPPLSSAAPTETFTVNWMIREVTNLFTWEISMYFDPSILECVSAVEPYPSGENIWKFYLKSLDNTAGYVFILAGRPLGIAEGLSGTWKLATITFNVKAEGTSALHFESTQLAEPPIDTTVILIPHDVEDGYFSNLPPEVHDVAVTSVTPSPTDVLVGDPVTITVGVVNEGDFSETFSVTVYFDDTAAAPAQPVTDLAPAATDTLVFEWDTTGVAADTYTIRAEASVVDGETDTGDNLLIDDQVTISTAPPPEVHDVAVTSLTAPTEATEGDIVTVDVGLENQGDQEETFELKISIDGTIFFTKAVTLAEGQFVTEWADLDTSIVSPSTYIIRAEAVLVTDEDPADNWKETTITVTPISVVTATVDIAPETLNLKSRGRWITCYIQLPEGYDVEDVDISTILLQGVIPAEWAVIENGVLMVKFDRAAVIEHILDVLGTTDGQIVFTVTCSDLQGTPFEGSDTIRVMSKGK